MTFRLIVGAVLATGIAVAVSGAVLAQSAASSLPPARDELLAEIRALRADLAQAMSANIRAQLLVGRLQLQEQRMTALGAQLAGVQQALDAAERERVDQADRLADLQNALSAGQLPADEEQAIRQETARMKTDLSRVDAQLQGLRTDAADLSGQLTAEQGRWIEFNNRLDDIERWLPAPAGATVR
jgi:hypothetical protein